MKLFNLKFLCIFSLILTSTLALKKSNLKSQNHFLNKALKAEMVKTASKILSKIYYTKEILKSLDKLISENIFDSEKPEIKINDALGEKSCKNILEEKMHVDHHFLVPEYYETFLETENLQQDFVFRIKLFFKSQSSDEVKKCAERVVDKSEKVVYDKAKETLHREIKGILEPLRGSALSKSEELITSVMSVHRQFMTKELLQKLNHEI